MFKGINLGRKDDFPYTQMYRMLDHRINETQEVADRIGFPFQLDQTIINGKYFFEMV